MPLKHTVQKVTSDSGITGLLIDIPDAASFHYEIFFHGGYHAFTDPAKQQTAHVLEHIAADGAASGYNTKAAYLHDFYKNGAYTNAMTYYAGVWYFGNNTVGEWQRILGLRRLSLEHPMLSEETFRSELGNATAEMKRNVNTYASVSYRLAAKTMGVPSLLADEHIESMKSLTLTDVSDFYAANHVTENMKFSIAGDIGARTDDIMKFFDGWKLPSGKKSIQTPVVLRHGGAFAYRRVASAASVYMTVSFGISRRFSQAERTAFGLVNAYLINLRSSKILGEARRRGIAYELHGFVDTDAEGVTMWHISAPIAPENLQALTELITAELGKVMNEDIPADEFAYAASYSTGRARQQGQTPEALSDLYANPYFYDGAVFDFTDIDDVFRGITPQMIRGLVYEMIAARNWAVVGVGEIPEDDYKKTFDAYKQFISGVK